MPEIQQRRWGESDDVLWHTCAVVADVARGVPLRPAPVAAVFRPYLGADEQLLAAGPFTRYEHRPATPGSTPRRGGFFFATGAVGLTLTAAVAAGQAIGHARRRRAAQRESVERWVPVDHGTLTVSTHGFYLETAAGLFDWSWPSVVSAAVVEPGHLVVTGRTPHGPVRWVLRCPWAELTFALWALSQHPDHPQLSTGAWLPDGWLAWARQQRPDSPPDVPLLPPGPPRTR